MSLRSDMGELEQQPEPVYLDRYGRAWQGPRDPDERGWFGVGYVDDMRTWRDVEAECGPMKGPLVLPEGRGARR